MTYLKATEHLLASATYRMTMPEKSACQSIKDGNTDDESCRVMRQLMTEFAVELAKAKPIEPVTQRETPDRNEAGLL